MNNRIILFLLMVTCFASCINSKKTTYFQPLQNRTDIDTMAIKENFAITLHTGDILNITVNSLSPEANTMFNIFPAAAQSQGGGALSSAIGFLIDVDGNITLPLAGKIMVAGLTNKAAAELITKTLEKYLVQPTVNLRVLNYKISVLGEVAHPAVFSVTNEQITLLEAITLAGDVTVYGKRKNILIIREADGKREFARVDITNRALFNSPYYYLHPNDIVYVEPVKTKFNNGNLTIQLLPIILSTTTLLVVFYNLFK